jgi:hypothetical protein
MFETVMFKGIDSIKSLDITDDVRAAIVNVKKSKFLVSRLEEDRN